MPGAQWLDAEEQRIWRAYIDSIRLLTTALDRDLQHESGIPHGYYQILVLLSEAPGRTVRMSELAELSLSSRSRLSHAVARLEDAGWVTRATCPTDRRGALAVLTDAGLAALEAAVPAHVESVRRHLFDVLTPVQQHQLGEISAVIRDRLRSAGHDRCGQAPELALDRAGCGDGAEQPLLSG